MSDAACCPATPAPGGGRNYDVKAHYHRNKPGFKVTWLATRCTCFVGSKAEVRAWVQAHEERSSAT